MARAHALRRVILAFVLAIVPAGAAAGVNQTDSFRCGADLVCVGDSAAEVLMKCGEPSFTRATGAKGRSKTVRSRPVVKNAADTGEAKGKKKRSSVQKRTVYEETLSEVWTYNRGATNFIYDLQFEGGVLKSIKIGGRGR
jgi:hypothetical protein